MTDTPDSPIASLFIEAAHYTKANRGAVDVIVLHSMETPLTPGRAKQVAEWFAGENAPQASAHYGVDADAVVQCVHEKDIAWHAPGCNAKGIGIEHAAFAKWTAEEWATPQAEAMLRLSASLTAELCTRWGIPVVWLDATTLALPGARGVTSHKNVTDAFNHGQGHWDPGPNFPHAHYLELVQACIDTSQTPSEEPGNS